MIGVEAIRDTFSKFLHCSETELEEMVRKDRKFVEEKYGSEAVAKKFEDMYLFLTNDNQ